MTVSDQTYLVTQDDSPLYIFDSSLYDDAKKRFLLSEYSLPKYFTDGMYLRL